MDSVEGAVGMRRKSIAVGVLLVMFLIEVGCKSRTPEEIEARNIAAAERRAAKIPPPGSKFDRVKVGMSMQDVAATIGDSTDSAGHLMGKNFNPFYWGKDRYRRTWYYAGQGRLIFNTSAKLMKIEYDPSEDGTSGK